MKTDLEKRIMRRVYLLSLYKNLRARIPLKAFLLTIILSLSTKVFSYKVIMGYMVEIKIKDFASYLWSVLANAPVLKLTILAIILLLIYSTLKDIIKGTRENGNKGTSIKDIRV